MSTSRRYHLPCSACGQAFPVELVAAVQMTRMPEARQQILDGTFQVFSCPACGKPTAIESSLVYTDFARGQYVAVESAAGLSWQAAQMRHQAVFEECFVNAPSIARELGRGIRKRLVFGFRALREKLVLWDAELDDHVVEAVKGDLARELGLAPSEPVFRLARVLPGGHLLFARFPVTGPESQPGAGDQPVRMVLPAAEDYETAPRELYERRRDRRGQISADFPWLQQEWLIDIHDGPAYLYQ
jgi:transcription elongation factor Elf1